MGVTVLNTVAKAILTKKVRFQKRHEGSEVGTWGKNIPERGNSLSKGLKIQRYLSDYSQACPYRRKLKICYHQPKAISTVDGRWKKGVAKV